MIKVKNLVPDVYYDKSRDFQFLGRVFDVVFNYLKTNIDLIKEEPLSDNLDDTMVQLLASTIGFDTKHNYNTKDLKSICGVFTDLIRDKGSKIAIENACRTLMYTQNISGYLSVDRDTDDKYSLVIGIPSGLNDLILLEDLFDYILPAGFDFRFFNISKSTPFESTFNIKNTSTNFNLKNKNLSMIVEPNARESRPDEFSSDTIITDEDFSTTYTTLVYKPDEDSN